MPDGFAPKSASVVIEAPAVVSEMSNVPPVAIATMLDVAIEPEPDNASVPPLIVVAPV